MIFAVVLVVSSHPIGQEILFTLHEKLKKDRVPCSMVHPCPGQIRQNVKGWFENNPGIIEEVVVIYPLSSTAMDKRIGEEVNGILNVNIWTFDGRHNPEINEGGFRYFPNIYPEHMLEKDCVNRILAALGDKYLGEEFFKKLEEILSA